MRIPPPPLGSLTILAGCIVLCFSSCKKGPRSDAPPFPGVPTVRPRIVAELPHDSLAFTQGLFFDGGSMYESAGLYGKSSLRVIDALTGAVIRSVPVAPALFAEGCARLGPVLVQLTWREKTALVYSFPGCDVLRALAYDGEGWGLTADASHFYMSNGSDTLVVRAPDFTVKRKIAVRLGGRPLKNLNELEFVNGRVYANVWYSDYIFEIDPAAGTVARIIDCAEIVGREAAGSADNVLNGIAYDPGPGLFYLTGKNWRKMFLVDLALQK